MAGSIANSIITTYKGAVPGCQPMVSKKDRLLDGAMLYSHKQKTEEDKLL